MILSMLADHPYSLVTSAHSDSLILWETWTFSIFSERTSLKRLQSPSNEAFCSSSFFFSSSVLVELKSFCGGVSDLVSIEVLQLLEKFFHHF